MKIYTCALTPFEANAYFFTRDSGLLCRSFQSIGVESKVVMPRQREDKEDLNKDVVRGTMEELYSAAWWSSLGIDAVAIVTWGHAEDTPVIRAAKISGLKVILITDDGEGGQIPILNLLKFTWQKLYHLSFLRRAIETIAKFPILYIWFTWKKRGRYPQFRFADMITCWTSRVANNVRKGLKCTNNDKPKFLLGYPSSIDANRSFIDKDPSLPPSIIAVARWDAIKHKRPHFLMDVCRVLLEKDPCVIIHIYGKMIPLMHQVFDSLPTLQKNRLILHGVCDHSEILSCMRQSEVAICPSAADCGPVPMAEALCQGCSVVGGGNVAEWSAKTGYGTRVHSDTPVSFSEAVIKEIEKWNLGTYNRQENALFWREYYSVSRFAEKIRDFVEMNRDNLHAPVASHVKL